ncbi:MAG: ATP-binding protein [Myxococcota bacterium]
MSSPVPFVLPEALGHNARDLERELEWFAQVLDVRFRLYFEQEECEHTSVFEVTPPALSESPSAYAQLVRRLSLGFAERVALILALTPHIRPQLLDVFFVRNGRFDRPFTEFGGLVRSPRHDFVPTGETLAFVLAGRQLEIRFGLEQLFAREHAFTREDIVRLVPMPGQDQVRLQAPLRISEEWLARLTTAEPRRPAFGAEFPAQRIETALSWNDLVLHPGTQSQIDEIMAWIEHGDTLMSEWGMAPKLRPGYRSLFYGPPGAGKTMTACLMGRATGRDVYRVDLSLVVSKYIGETEKNLAKVFDQAQHKGWILFFDEADALFGKRSETKDARDRYANQEISFLLQRIEVFDGIAILASNFKENLDKAFARRFESVIYFPMPRPEERLRLWQQGFSARAQLDPRIDLGKIARDKVLSGGAIMNVIRYASMQALRRGENVIKSGDLQQGIRRELSKEGKG